MRLLKWIGGAVGCALVAACGASGASSTAFGTDDAGGGETFVDSGSGSPTDSGSVVKPTDSGVVIGEGGVIDSGPSGNPVGFPCAHPTDCNSGLCEPVIAGSGSVCVSTCTTQADCNDNFFCDPLGGDAGAGGYCVPHSPAHCAICTDDTDCGSLSEVCGIAAGDTAKACHVDCSLAPVAGTTSACPNDYSCQATTIDGVARQLCMPKAPIANCVDAVGGFCDRISTPQTCDRSNSAGICVGSRTCDASSNRYTTCSAAAPACRNCTTLNPVGCTENLCANAAVDVNNCGTCGNVCPGQSQAADNVTCVGSPLSCRFSCQGEHYDVNNSPADGCEISDPTTDNHTTNKPTSVGDRACYDGSSDPNISGRLPSDNRVHENNAVDGFDPRTGSAPDYYSIHATGESSIFNPCTDNVVLTLATSGAANPACYHMHVSTDKVQLDCDTDGSGGCMINASGTGQYTDGSTIVVEVYKVNKAGCTATDDDNPSYTVMGHL